VQVSPSISKPDMRKRENKQKEKEEKLYCETPSQSLTAQTFIQLGIRSKLFKVINTKAPERRFSMCSEKRSRRMSMASARMSRKVSMAEEKPIEKAIEKKEVTANGLQRSKKRQQLPLLLKAHHSRPIKT
jgi:hypothetical protein